MVCRPEKQPFFHIFYTFFQNRTIQKVVTAYRGLIYQIKANEIPSQMQKKSFRFDKKVCVGENFNLGICSKFGGNFEGILGNPGKIPHIG